MLRGLEDASLLGRDAHGRYSMHDLIRRYATDTAHHQLPDDLRHAALHRVVDFYLHTAHTADRLLNPHRATIHLDPEAPGCHQHPLHDDAAALAWLDAEYTCLLASHHVASTHRWDKAVWQLAWALHTFHQRRGHLRNYLATWQAALVATDRLNDPIARIHSQWHLGVAYAEMGRHDEATDHLNRALALAEHIEDRPKQVHTYNALAWASGKSGDDRRALRYAAHALTICRTLDDPLQEATALNAMGWSSARLGDYEQAREHCQAALALQRLHHHLDGEGATLDSLGYIAYHAGCHQEAVQHYLHALALFRAVGDTYATADSLDRLGHPHVALGELEQARAVWREALKLYQSQQRQDADRVQQQLDVFGDSAQD
ncbi:tetratricopeptide (TPR) repeat protein [Saccharothrix tamanrassetensis]|uniref:Tetratricopeptide (TPR) repeat protein n=1 Tax=Saccharothrix tamanrassetensis TaxID=1051531 RepID=A0A841CSQ6_9PSEU|nr:tetratricopeptide repeat protein [Saccharothrix tamanrassetensis]MBB5958466.1 tetratricopeptide (TPR) repeat protein [Saccharothrix tamanrassetensis]